jgi:hypothetical protein
LGAGEFGQVEGEHAEPADDDTPAPAEDTPGEA